jgi:hypothetical protein
MYGEPLLGATITKFALVSLVIVGCVAQLDALQILDLDRLFTAIARLLVRRR